jgi:hypothetical protein
MDRDFELDPPAAKIGPREPWWRKQMSVWTLMKLVLVLGSSLGLFVLLARAAADAREAARRAQCMGNLKQLGLALHNYHVAYDALPPAYIADASGRPMHSWRVLLLPFMGESALYNRYDFSEPWNGPNNIKLLNNMPWTFACPSWHDYPPTSTTLTSYVAVTGPGTMFPGTSSTKFADVTDGISETLMIVEVADVKIPWTAPQDLDVRTMSFRVNDPKRLGISSKHPGGANVGLGDDAIRFMRESIVPGNLRSLVTIAGGAAISADEALPSK